MEEYAGAAHITNLKERKENYDQYHQLGILREMLIIGEMTGVHGSREQIIKQNVLFTDVTYKYGDLEYSVRVLTRKQGKLITGVHRKQ